MKLQKLKLNNIGPYLDVAIDFQTKELKNQNLILFGGKNGAGKTTLLNAIKIVLYGVNAFGFKNEGATYFQEIKKLLNYKSLKNETSRYYIEIEYEEVESFQKNRYTIRREWFVTASGLEESATVLINGTALKQIEIVKFQEKLRQKYPLKVMESFLFDGEKINRHIIENTTGDYLRETMYALFQIELFEQLDRDLNAYLTTMEANKVLSQDEVELLHKKNDLLSQKRKITILEQKRKNIENEKKQLVLDKEHIQQKLQSLGYLSKTQGEQLRNEMKAAETQKKVKNEKVRQFINDDYFFALTMPLLNQAQIQLKQEYPIQLVRRLDELETYLGASKEIDELRQKFDGKLIGSSIHQVLEFEQLNAVEQFSQEIETKQAAFKAVIAQEIADLDTLKEMIELQETTDEVKELLEALSTFNQKYGNYEHILEQVELDLKREVVIQEQLQLEYEQLKQKSQSEKSTTGSLTLAENYLQVIQKFKAVQIQKLVAQLETKVLEKFSHVIRKKGYVNQIKIDPETFDITLYDMDNDQKAIGLLSAGEAQILMGSII
ncbi:MAG: DNA sulfur modification protein DndD, partial [Culicoidibacterales bacterium]